MRLYKVVAFITIVVMLGACSCGEKAGKYDVGRSISDTLIHSSPSNYKLTIENGAGSSKVKVRDYKDMFTLFDKLDYTPEAWQAGIREVPRVYLLILGDSWAIKSQDLTIENKKQLFFRGLAPLILRTNELILIDRDRLEEIKSSFDKNKALSEKENSWVRKLAKSYKVNSTEEQVTSAILEELWKRVDIVPASLALAQAAEESGWGTSRFASKGNAVYGQWTWGGNSIKPEKQRKELGNYGIAAFGSLQESVSAYMLNLNTHNAYAGLRDKRSDLRNLNQKVTGLLMAETLTKYSERGEEYVKGVKLMINSNRLSPTDEAYLSKDPPIYLVPVVE